MDRVSPSPTSSSSSMKAHAAAPMSVIGINVPGTSQLFLIIETMSGAPVWCRGTQS